MLPHGCRSFRTLSAAPAGSGTFFLHGAAPFPARFWDRAQFSRDGGAGSVYGKEASQQLVYVPGFPDFLRGTEGDGLPGGSGARRAADAVHIDLRFFRQIIVDDKPYVFYVNAAGGDVRGDEDRRFPGTEFTEHAFAPRPGFCPREWRKPDNPFRTGRKPGGLLHAWSG